MMNMNMERARATGVKKVKKNFTMKPSTRTFMFELYDSVCLQ